jgi:hypothetical protein
MNLRLVVLPTLAVLLTWEASSPGSPSKLHPAFKPQERVTASSPDGLHSAFDPEPETETVAFATGSLRSVRMHS